MAHPSAWEIIVIAVLLFVIFGGRRLPELGRAVFRRAFKKNAG